MKKMDPARQSKKLDSLVTELVSGVLPGETVLGVGVDIVEVRRITALKDRPEGSFLERSFTPAEIDECTGRANPSIHYAGKWAAKEGVYKALRLHWNRPFSWKEIEILSPDSCGRGIPQVNLSEQIQGQTRREEWREEQRGEQERGEKREAPRLLLSISHTDEYAFAVVLAVGPA